MASDSEPRKFFIEAPSRPPQKSHFGKQNACEAILMSNDSARVEVGQ